MTQLIVRMNQDQWRAVGQERRAKRRAILEKDGLDAFVLRSLLEGHRVAIFEPRNGEEGTVIVDERPKA